MSRLIARILLAILVFPLGALLDLAAYMSLDRHGMNRDPVLQALLFTWAFVAAYWILLWRGSVAWTRPRVLWTAGAAAAAALGGFIVAMLLSPVDDGVARFCGGALAILLWVVFTIFIWRESPQERAARLKGAAGGVVCPTCGYNLTGLTATRCPECGTQFTLDELLASQPGRAAVELEA